MATEGIEPIFFTETRLTSLEATQWGTQDTARSRRAAVDCSSGDRS